MATVTISKIKIRRGTDAQRQHVVFDQGEPAYTTDTRRLYIGSGTLSGGVVVGSKIHDTLLNLFSLSTLKAELNDVVVVNNKLYQLTLPDYTNINSWTDISTKVDPLFFSYNTNNFITLNLSSIDASFFDPSSIGAGLKINLGVLQADYDTDTIAISSNKLTVKASGITEYEIASTALTGGLIGGNNNKLRIDFNTKSLEISANKLSLKAAGIDEREISSSALSSGLIGGSGSKLRLNVNTNYFGFSANQLILTGSTPLQFESLQEDWFSNGLIYNGGLEQISTVLQTNDGPTISLSSGAISVNPSMFHSGLKFNTTTKKVSADLVGVDNITLTKVLSTGIVSLSNINATAAVEWPHITVDAYGRVTEVQSAVYDIFECLSASNYFGPLSSIFNGNPTGIINGGGNPNNITKFKVLSSDYVTQLELSSSGFLVFEGNYTTRGFFGDTIPRFAIPIFRF